MPLLYKPDDQSPSQETISMVAPIYNSSTSMVARWVVETGEVLEGYLAKDAGMGSSTRDTPTSLRWKERTNS